MGSLSTVDHGLGRSTAPTERSSSPGPVRSQGPITGPKVAGSNEAAGRRCWEGTPRLPSDATEQFEGRHNGMISSGILLRTAISNQLQRPESKKQMSVPVLRSQR